MKTLRLLIFLCICQFVWSQDNGINYKAVIRDNSGNLMANETIAVQFTILKGASQTNIYQEAHGATTDANGIVNLNIGKGSSEDVFSDIDWEGFSHFLNVQVNFGSGLVDLGTTKFQAVPYALNAQNANNVTGLETLDEGNGVGWRLIDENPANHGNIGPMALDLSHHDSSSSTHGATGESSIALGQSTTASGSYSTSLGLQTNAQSYASVALGRYNVGGGASGYWYHPDPLLEVGNGLDASNKSNALTILKNGTVTAPSFDVWEITDNKSLITKEYFEDEIPSGLDWISEGNGYGHAFSNRYASQYGAIGQYAVDLSRNNTASETKGATGNSSVAMGFGTTASGPISTALGHETIASGDGSIAIGVYTRAESLTSTALGRYNIGGGLPTSWKATDPLFEIGNGTSLSNTSNALTVLKNGKVGIGEHQPDGFLEIKATNGSTEPHIKLVHEGSSGARISFTNTEVSNATSNKWTLYGDVNNSPANSVFNIFHPFKGNIIRIHGDGQIGMNGIPDTDFHVYHGTVSDTHGFKLESTGAQGDWWRFHVTNSLSSLRLYTKSQGQSAVGSFDADTGTYFALSDKRLKKDFKPLPFSWENFTSLATYSYLYKTQKDQKRSLGLIAQDVDNIYPELVTYNQEDDVYHLNYSGLGVVAIKAIQELKAEVDILKEENGSLKEKLSKLDDLEARLSTIETRNDNRSNFIHNDQ